MKDFLTVRKMKPPRDGSFKFCTKEEIEEFKSSISSECPLFENAPRFCNDESLWFYTPIGNAFVCLWRNKQHWLKASIYPFQYSDLHNANLFVDQYLLTVRNQERLEEIYNSPISHWDD